MTREDFIALATEEGMPRSCAEHLQGTSQDILEGADMPHSELTRIVRDVARKWVSTVRAKGAEGYRQWLEAHGLSPEISICEASRWAKKYDWLT